MDKLTITKDNIWDIIEANWNYLYATEANVVIACEMYPMRNPNGKVDLRNRSNRDLSSIKITPWWTDWKNSTISRPSFKICAGDIVKFKPDYALTHMIKSTYTVQNLCPRNGITLAHIVECDSKQEVITSLSYLMLAKQTEVKVRSPFPFSVGDKVKFISGIPSPYPNEVTFTVAYMYFDEDDKMYAHITNSYNTLQIAVLAKTLTLVQDSQDTTEKDTTPKFKPKDKVKLVRRHDADFGLAELAWDMYMGKVFIVETYTKNSKGMPAIITTDSYIIWPAECFDLVEVASEKPKQRFQLGDTVKLVHEYVGHDKKSNSGYRCGISPQLWTKCKNKTSTVDGVFTQRHIRKDVQYISLEKSPYKWPAECFELVKDEEETTPQKDYYPWENWKASDFF